MSYDYEYGEYRKSAVVPSPERDRPDDEATTRSDGSGRLDRSQLNAALVLLLDKICELQRDVQRQSARHLRQVQDTQARQFERALAFQAEHIEKTLRFHAEQAEQAYQRGQQYQAWQKWAIAVGASIIVLLVVLVFIT